MPDTGNRLLDTLSQPVLQKFLQGSRLVDLPIRTHLIGLGEVPTSIYFLVGGAASAVVTMAQGGSAEVGMVGSEGVVGGAALMGPLLSTAEWFMQIGGSGLRVPIKLMQELFNTSPELRHSILQFTQVQMSISEQLSACNRLHEAEGRLARWLLTASDLTHSARLGLTQEFLAQMLGSQRTTVALVAGVLQRSGLIDYSRGNVHIVDREGLEAVACACYKVTRDALLTLYPQNPPSSTLPPSAGSRLAA